MSSSEHPIILVDGHAIQHPYLPWQINFLGYLSLGTASLSLIGSSLICLHVLGPSGRQKNLSKPHLRILLAMSVNDVLFSGVTVLNLVLYPAGFGWPSAQHGTMTTCRLFGFVAQLSLATGALNALLCLYYWSTICRGLDKRLWVRRERGAYGLIFGGFVVLAALGTYLEIYNPFLEGNVCWIAPYPPRCESDSYPDVKCDNYPAQRFEFFYVLFSDIWVLTYIVIVVVTNILIWRKVRRQHKKMEHYQKQQAAQQQQQAVRMDPSEDFHPSRNDYDNSDSHDTNGEDGVATTAERTTPEACSNKSVITPANNLDTSSWAVASLSVAEHNLTTTAPSNDNDKDHSNATKTTTNMQPPPPPQQQQYKNSMMKPANLSTSSWAAASLSVAEHHTTTTTTTVPPPPPPPPSSDSPIFPNGPPPSPGQRRPPSTTTTTNHRTTPFLVSSSGGTTSPDLGTDSWAAASLSVAEPPDLTPPPTTATTTPLQSSANSSSSNGTKRTPFLSSGNARGSGSLGTTDSWAGASLSVAEPPSGGGGPGYNNPRSSWANATVPWRSEDRMANQLAAANAKSGDNSSSNKELSDTLSDSGDSVEDGPYQARNRLKHKPRRGRRRQQKEQQEQQLQDINETDGSAAETTNMNLTKDSGSSTHSRSTRVASIAKGLRSTATAAMSLGRLSSHNTINSYERRRRAQEQTRAKRERQIFIQCLLFTLSFLSSMLPSMILKVCFIFWGYLAFWQFALLATFWPLQGFFNALIFGRPIYVRVRNHYPELSVWETLYQVFFTEDPLHRSSTVYNQTSFVQRIRDSLRRKSTKSGKDSMNTSGHSLNRRSGHKKESLESALSDLDFQNQEMLKHSGHMLSNHSLENKRSLHDVAEEQSTRSNRDFYDDDYDDDDTFHNGTEREGDDVLAPLPSDNLNESVLIAKIRQYEEQQGADYDDINEDDFKEDE